MQETEVRKKPRRGPTGGFTKPEPFHPERVLGMFKLRREGATIKQIGIAFGITPPGAAHNLKRWREWAEGKY